MFATVPAQTFPPSTAMGSPSTIRLGQLPCSPVKTRHGSPLASTRASSPSCSTASSEEVAALDAGALARRRGRNVLMLSELVVEGDISSPAGTCMAQRAMAFDISVLPEFPNLSAIERNCVAEHRLLRTSPMQPAVDASGVCSTAARLGGAAAGGDASQRSPMRASQLSGPPAVGDASQRNRIGSLSLGVAMLHSDASQRSPVACMGGTPLPTPKPVQCRCEGSWIAGNIIPLNPCDSSWSNAKFGSLQVLMGTCPLARSPDLSHSSNRDASQRTPGGSVPTLVTAAHGCSGSLKSWLSGASSVNSSESGSDLAERLRAAAPETYED